MNRENINIFIFTYYFIKKIKKNTFFRVILQSFWNTCESLGELEVVVETLESWGLYIIYAACMCIEQGKNEPQTKLTKKNSEFSIYPPFWLAFPLRFLALPPSIRVFITVWKHGECFLYFSYKSCIVAINENMVNVV